MLSSMRETPCDQLTSKTGTLSDRAYASSVSFLNTMRLQEWKPMDRSGMNPDRSYCYLTVDSNVGIDNLWPGESCVFPGSNPFITRSFMDKAQDATRSSAIKKCVMEIDPKIVNDDHLNRFWTGMGSMDCSNLEFAYQKLNADLASGNHLLTDELNGFLVLDLTNENKMTSLRATIEDLQTKIQANRVTLNNLYTDSNTVAEAIARGKVEAAACKSNADQLTVDVQVCASNLTGFLAMSKAVNDAYAFSNQVFKQDQVKYNQTVQAISTLKQSLESKRAEVGLKKEEWSGNVRLLNTCNGRVTDMKSAYFGCQSNLFDTSNALNVCTQSNTVCQSNWLATSNDYRECEQGLPGLWATWSNNDLTYRDCGKSNAECLVTRVSRVEQETALNHEIQDWLSNHQNCTPCNVVIESLKSSVDEILAWCKFPLEAASMLKSSLIQSMQQGTIGLQNQLQACETGRDTLPTTLPARPRKEKVPRGPPGTTARPTPPTCTMVLSAAYCDPSDRSKCWADDNVYLKFNNSRWNNYPEIPVISIPIGDYYNNGVVNTSKVRDSIWNQAKEKWAHFFLGLFLTESDWASHWISEYDQGRYRLRKPYVYTSSGPGHENAAPTNLTWPDDWWGNFQGDEGGGNSTGNGRLGEIVQLIPNNGAYCSFTTNNGGAIYGSIHAINQKPVGTKFGYSHNGMQFRNAGAGDGNGPGRGEMWDNMNMNSLNLYTGVAESNCSFSNVMNTGDFASWWMDPCKSTYKFNKVPLDKNPILG